MNPPSIAGLWRYSAPGFSGEYDFMCIDEVRGRIISFAVIQTGPVQFAPMRGWFRRESATSVGVRLHPSGDWKVHEIESVGEHLVWRTSVGAVFTMDPVSPEQVPEWLEEKLAAQNLRMDVEE